MSDSALSAAASLTDQNSSIAFGTSFVVGAILIIIYQTVKFRQINLHTELAKRYVGDLASATAREFVEKNEYYTALVFFIVISLAIYTALCQVSPFILSGAVKLVSGGAEPAILKSLPYPLYITALLLGLTQPIIPWISTKFGDGPRDFLHNQISVPRRVLEACEASANAIEERAGADKRKLIKEIKFLAGDRWLAELGKFGDRLAYDGVIDEQGLRGADISETLSDSSVRELRQTIAKLLLASFRGVMRQSGHRGLLAMAQMLQVHLPSPGQEFSFWVASFIIGGLTFIFLSGLISVFLYQLDYPVSVLMRTSQEKDLWPSSLELVNADAVALLITSFCCLAIALFMYKRMVNSPEVYVPSILPLSTSSVVEFTRSFAFLLGACFIVAMSFSIMQLLYDFGVDNQPFAPDMIRSLPRKMELFCFKALIQIVLCLGVIAYLQIVGSVLAHRLFWLWLIALGALAGFLALLYDLMWLHLDFLPRQASMPQVWRQEHGSETWLEHVLYTVLLNSLAACAAFAAAVAFFQVRAAVKDPRNTSSNILQERLASVAEPYTGDQCEHSENPELAARSDGLHRLEQPQEGI